MKKILVHHKRNETSVAIIENSTLINFFVDREDNPHLLGNIYKGKIKNILPGMQAVFVDIGRDKNAFLQRDHKQNYQVGQEILIQIKKESIGTKGPRATTSLSIPSHHIVLLPRMKYIGISKKIDNISALLGMSMSSVSHQLRVLKQSNLVKYRKAGRVIYYSLADEHVKTICRQGMDHVLEDD